MSWTKQRNGLLSMLLKQHYDGTGDSQKPLILLKTIPTRCGLAVENSSATKEIRELLYGRNRSYRALFTIRGDEVFILTIRHTAQQNLQAADLRLLGLD